MSTVNRSEVKSASFWLDALEDAVAGESNSISTLGSGARSLTSWIADGLDFTPQTSLPLPPPSLKPAPGKASTEELVADLLRWEGNVGHMYRCTAGRVTIGIGNMIPTAEAAKKLPFIDAKTGKPASQEQIEAAFANVDGMPKGMAAMKYASATTLRLPVETVRQLATDRLNEEFLPALRRQFDGFDSYPPSAQKALVDMVYNLGVGGLRKFANLEAACEAGDWARAGAECNRSPSRPERNEWTRQMFLQAAGK